MYGDEIVNFVVACSDSSNLPDLKVDCKANLINAKEIDTRNLTFCQELNLSGLLILSFSYQHLSKLRVKVLYLSKIQSLYTQQLTSVEYLVL